MPNPITPTGRRSLQRTDAIRHSTQLSQIAEIERGLVEADAGDFATDEEVAAMFRQWRRTGRVAARRGSVPR